VVRIEELQQVHKLCIYHRDAVLRSERCGCFYCLRWFLPAEVTEWIDSPSADDDQPGQTALCPHCGIDAVLPGTLPMGPLCSNLLLAMRRYFFDA